MPILPVQNVSSGVIDVTQKGVTTGTGTVTQINQGANVTLTPNPITAAGTIDVSLGAGSVTDGMLATSYVKADGTRALTGTWGAGNYAINSRNSVDWLNAVTLGADPTGSADSTTAIQNAINALTDGQTLFFPPGTYKITATITVGDGSVAAPSTYNFIKLIGAGPGHESNEQNPLDGGTTLAWYGAAAGTMMQVKGPISSIEIKGFRFDASAGANTASTALEIIHAFNSDFSHLSVGRQSGYAYYIRSLNNPANNATNTQQNLFSSVCANYGAGTAYGGLQIGGTDSTLERGNSRLTFVNCSFIGGATGRAANLRFCDNITFIQTGISGFNYGLVITPPTNGVNMPAALDFHNCFINGSTAPLYVDTTYNSWTPPTGIGATFQPWCSDNGTVPWNPPHYGFNAAMTDTGIVSTRTALISKNATTVIAPRDAATQLQVINADGSQSVAELASFGAHCAVSMSRAQGTYSAKTNVTNGVSIANLYGYGYGATGYSSAPRARIRFSAAENWTDAAQGTNIQIVGTTIGTTTDYNGIFIDGYGRVGVNTWSPTSALTVNGTVELANGSGGGFKFADGSIQTTAVGVGGACPTSRVIATTAPLSGGGDLTADRTLSLSITTTNDGGAVVKQAATPGTQQTGNINVSGTILAGTAVNVSASANSTVAGQIYNSSAGVSAMSQYDLRSDNANADFELYSSGYTGSGARQASAAGLIANANATGGLSIAAQASAPIRFYTAGVSSTDEKFRIASDGLLTNTLLTLAGKSPGVFFVQTADSTTLANTLTTLFGSGGGTLTLPANFLTVGRTIKIELAGYVSTADGAGGTKTLTLSLGGTTVATGTSTAAITTLLNQPWKATAYITCRTTGAPGTVVGYADWSTGIAASTALYGLQVASTAAVSVTTTGTLAIDLKFNNGNATGAIKTTVATVSWGY